MASNFKDKKNLTFFVLLVVLFLLNVAVLLGSELPAFKQSLIPPTASATTVPTKTNTPTLPPTQTPSPAPSPTPIPVVALAPVASNLPVSFSGLVVFSMADNGYAHLYLYQPGAQSFTRITNDPWDDVEPALSPDGTRIAYSSKRNGYWNIYILSLSDGSNQQITDTPAFDTAPTWSPDGTYLAFTTIVRQNKEIAIASLGQPGTAPVYLTTDGGNNDDPSWSPQGRKIAFITDRTGLPQVWVADLDQSENRFTQIPFDSQSNPRHPAWSPDGNRIAWVADQNQVSTIFTWEISHPDQSPRVIGSGSLFAWNPESSMILAVPATASQNYLTAYDLSTLNYTLPPQLMTGLIYGVDWKAGNFPASLPENLYRASQESQPAVWQQQITPPVQNVSGRYGLVDLNQVSAPYAKLSDQVDEGFEALRQRVIQETGWDFFANLENAFIPLTSPSLPGMSQDWLYTGRAIAVNTVPLSVNWMVVTREDIGMETYWRIYLRPIYQDGSMGQPVNHKPWDFDARFKGDPAAYEHGGVQLNQIPDGYWVDFTDLAARYGWERQPAMANWTSFYQGARYNEYVLRANLDWRTAMTELYPSDALVTPTGEAPATATPPILNKTPSPTGIPSATITPRPTWTPYSPGQTP
jgi:TolB protein